LRLSRISFSLFAGIFLLGVYTVLLEPLWVEVTTTSIPVDNLPRVFDGYRIVHLSDWHVDGVSSGAYLQRVVSLTNQQDADLVVISGDFLSRSSEPYRAEMIQRLSELRARDGVVVVLGNHDHWVDVEFIRSVLAESAVRELRNDVLVIDRQGASLAVAGLDDYYDGESNMSSVMEKLPVNVPAILLIHEPDYADWSALTGRFFLQLSGHTHGGQVNVPYWGALVLPEHGKKYWAGLYRVNDMWVYTTRGIGMSPPQVRFNCRPEISVLTLQSR